MGTAAAAATAVAVGLQAYDAHEQRKAAKKADRAQRRELAKQQQAIDEQNQEAMSERRQKIDQMRMQLAGTGQGTRGTSWGGIANSVRARVGGQSGGTLG